MNVNGAIEVYDRSLADGGTGNCLALVNFWRTISNLHINVNKAGQDGCRADRQLLGGVSSRLYASGST